MTIFAWLRLWLQSWRSKEKRVAGPFDSAIGLLEGVRDDPLLFEAMMVVMDTKHPYGVTVGTRHLEELLQFDKLRVDPCILPAHLRPYPYGTGIIKVYPVTVSGMMWHSDLVAVLGRNGFRSAVIEETLEFIIAYPDVKVPLPWGCPDHFPFLSCDTIWEKDDKHFCVIIEKQEDGCFTVEVAQVPSGDGGWLDQPDKYLLFVKK